MTAIDFRTDPVTARRHRVVSLVPTKRSALFVLTYPSAPIPFLRICHSRRLSAKIELPDPLGQPFSRHPRPKAPPDPLGRDV